MNAMMKVEALRAGSKVVHFGLPTRVRDVDGSVLYRIACQGRNASFYVRAGVDQSIPVTCSKCSSKKA